MNKNNQWMRDALSVAFTPRRVFALLIGWGCLAVGGLVVLGVVQLDLWVILMVWIAGLIVLEWAG